jgi:hypothetical protein
MSWWWCLDHKQVEQDAGCPKRSTNRLGPYESEQQAATAVERIHARNIEQDARDKADDKK